MSYLVPAGLYAVGTPGPEAAVVVTANYKMSYDTVRSALQGRSVWLLVLETFGINVWCAAGKGTFGTDELVRRVKATALASVVSHRRLFLPILGAPGIAAHEVKGRTGFTVQYATVRAADLPRFLDNGMVAEPAMRELTFTFGERLALVPVELAMAAKSTLVIGGVLFLLGGWGGGSFSPGRGAMPLLAYLGALAAGAAVTPLLLPWLPGRSFAVKGALAGIGWSALWLLLRGEGGNPFSAAAAFLVLPAVSAFYALNFTGSTPFTSRSGVKKEMRLALPAVGVALVAGAVSWIAGRFW